MKKLYFLLVISLFLAIPCAARVIIVDANGTGDYPTIQAAIDDSNDGDIVEVQQGTYTGAGNRDIDFLGKAITVRSINPQDPCVVASTVIDCQGAGRGFYFHSGEEANSVLNGLKITNGYVTTISTGGNAGAGIYCGNESGPTIANCHISGNTAVMGSSGRGIGGGIYGCDGIITNCTISGNTATGDMLPGGGRGGGLYACNGTITNCSIIGNTATKGGEGGGLYGCNGTIINCTISGNTVTVHGGGGGLNGCNGTITNCTISGNTVYGDDILVSSGGGLYKCNGTIANCTIIGNTVGGYGGGLYRCNGTIANCTISGNTAYGGSSASRGGGLYDCGGSITNCIIWSNSADVGPELRVSSDPNYSCIKDWISGGIGNIDDDPCFVDANNGDYHLKSQAGRWDANSESWVLDNVTSPCIDAGNPGCPLRDEPNGPNNVRINMGAYGGTAEASKSPANWRSIADTTNDWVVDSNDLKVFVSYWLQTGKCIPSDFNRSRSVDFNDFAIFGLQWQGKNPGPGMTYETGACIPEDFASSAAGESEPTRFTVTVEGRNIRFEDMMRANCCPDELELQMTAEADLITIYEIEHTTMPCTYMCNYPITATLGPYEPGTYTLAVYQNSSLIGTTTVTIENGG